MLDNSISFSAAGDILITKRVPSENQGIDIINNFISKADVRMANLETTITDGSCFPSACSGGTWVTAQEECLDDIKKYGFNLLGFSNNHSMDYSYDGLKATLRNIKGHGYYCAGAGDNLYEASKPAIIETANGRVGVIDICSTFEENSRAGSQTERQPGRPGINTLRFKTVYRITQTHAEELQEIANAVQINALRESHRSQGFISPLKEGTIEFGTNIFELVESNEQEGRFSYVNPNDMERTVKGIEEALFSCEVVIIMVHSHEIKGIEEYEADYFMEEFAHLCIDAGASAVIGSGTHQVKGIELYKDCPIFYGLGNFIFENEYVRLLPADFMEKYGLSIHASAVDGIKERLKYSKKSLYEIPEVYQTILPYFEIRDKKCTDIELLPINLGFGKERHLRSLPYVADEKEAYEILEYLNKACQCYDVRWKYDGQKFVLA